MYNNKTKGKSLVPMPMDKFKSTLSFCCCFVLGERANDSSVCVCGGEGYVRPQEDKSKAISGSIMQLYFSAHD